MDIKELKDHIDTIANGLFDRLEAIEHKLDWYKKHVIDGREMIDNQDVCRVMKVGKRSLYRYRRNGELRFSKFHGKIYYDIEDVERLMQKIMK